MVVDQSRSLAEMAAKLKEVGFEPYYRKWKIQGVMVEGRKYRLRRLGINLQEVNKNTIPISDLFR